MPRIDLWGPGSVVVIGDDVVDDFRVKVTSGNRAGGAADSAIAVCVAASPEALEEIARRLRWAESEGRGLCVQATMEVGHGVVALFKPLSIHLRDRGHEPDEASGASAPTAPGDKANASAGESGCDG